MSQWTPDELNAIGAADEIQVASGATAGSLRRSVPIWIVRVGDDLYVRSYRGRDGGWFRRALAHHHGRIRAAGVERDVVFHEPDDLDHPAIDRAYRTKYAQHGARYVDPMVSPKAAAATLRLVPG